MMGQGDNPVGLDHNTLRMFEAFNLYMRQQNVEQRKEALTTKALHSIVDKIDQFDGRDVSKYIRVYSREMELNKISEVEMIGSFDLAVVPEIRGRVRELKVSDGENWETFIQALKEEFFMEDSERVTKRTFLEWVARPNKGLSANELLREFERQYAQLTGTEKTTLDVEKTELFIQAADVRLQELLEPILEDRNEERGLKTDWKEVVGAVSLLTKRQRRRDKNVASEVKTTVLPMTHTYGKPLTTNSKGDDTAMDELVKGIRELKIKFAKLEENGQSLEGPIKQSFGQKSNQLGGRLPPRCMWCDSFDHSRRECEEFTEALRNDKVFFKEGRIHSRESGLPLETNFGKGGMKFLMEGTSRVHATEARAYGIGVDSLIRDCMGISIESPDQISSFWPSAMKFAESGEFCKDALLHAGKAIRQTTGWSDPVDALSVHAYIAKIQHEAIVEDKRKRDDTNDGSSKRPTRSDKGRQPTFPVREETMKDAPSTSKEKGKGPAYKLQSDIEAATDLKKVLEERILNGKVEFTLGEVLGIAKREFHEVIIDIIKRKRQAMGENLTSIAHGTRVMRDDDEVAYGDVSRIDFIMDEGEDQTPSHFSRSHWARATTETLVKLGNLEEPLVALVDHGSEINLMSKELYEMGKWPIDTDHGWMIRAANNSRGNLYGACPNVKVSIGDVVDEQNFFVQDKSTYPIILGQPFITASRMETKVMDNGSAYARIRSRDGKKAVQFLTVCANHERNRENLRENPLPKIHKEFRDLEDSRDFHRMPL